MPIRKTKNKNKQTDLNDKELLALAEEAQIRLAMIRIQLKSYHFN